VETVMRVFHNLRDKQNNDFILRISERLDAPVDVWRLKASAMLSTAAKDKAASLKAQKKGVAAEEEKVAFLKDYTETLAYPCRTCKTELTYLQYRQNRCGDEAPTGFVICYSCRAKWNV